MTTKADAGPMNLPGGQASSFGDNILDRVTADGSGGGIGNEPAFPNNNTTQPSGQGGSSVFGGIAVPTPPSGDAVPQAFGTLGAGIPPVAGLPEQDYAKPTDAVTPAALQGLLPRG